MLVRKCIYVVRNDTGYIWSLVIDSYPCGPDIIYTFGMFYLLQNPC